MLQGQQYEDIARDIYIEQYNDPVVEFGLILHPVHRFLGGSPDGISLHPRLIEIKANLHAHCPFCSPSNTDNAL